MSKKKILIVTANSDTSEQIRTDRFINEIENGLRDAQKQNFYDIEVALASSLDLFLVKLEHYKPHILHLIGHGNRMENFIFEDEYGQNEVAWTNKFVSVINQYKETIECVIVTACHSQDLAIKIGKDTAYAIGYDGSLGVDVAKKYCNQFYFYLASENDYNLANSKTRNALALKIPIDEIPNIYFNDTLKTKPIYNPSSEYISREEIIKLMDKDSLSKNELQFIETYNYELGWNVTEESLNKVYTFSSKAIKVVRLLPALLVEHYQTSSIFTTIPIQHPIESNSEMLSMEDYFIQPSYIPIEKRRDKNYHVLAENETSRTKVKKSRAFAHLLPEDYISGGFFSNEKRIAISGNPGVGKSTYARWLAYKWAKKQLSLDAVLIYINLRNLNYSASNMLIDYILREYGRGKINEQGLKEVLTSDLNQNTCFILDGFDELDKERQYKLKVDLYSLSANSRYLLLSRPYGLLNTFGLGWDTEIQIDGFSQNHIEAYIRNLVKEPNKIDKLHDIIDKNDVLSDYAHNPSMLSFIVYLYNENAQAARQLAEVTSVYDLQDKVYQWIKQRSEAKSVKNYNTEDKKQAEEFAYFLEIRKKVYHDTSDRDTYLPTVEYLSDLGLGTHYSVVENISRFSFNTITFQEFLTALFLKEKMTDESLMYLVKDNFFWNLSKMIIGGLSEQKNTSVIDDTILIIRNLYLDTSQYKFKYLYYSFISETTKTHLNQILSSQLSIEELYFSYKEAYYNYEWRLLFTDAILRIYSKLQVGSKSLFRELILSDIQNFMNAQISTDIGVELDDSVKYLMLQLSLYKHNDFTLRILDFYKEFISRVEEYDYFDKYYGLCSFFLEWLEKIDKSIIYGEVKEKLEETILISPVQFIEIISKISAKTSDFKNAWQDLQMYKAKWEEPHENDKETVFLLKKMASSIYICCVNFKESDFLSLEGFIKEITILAYIISDKIVFLNTQHFYDEDEDIEEYSIEDSLTDYDQYSLETMTDEDEQEVSFTDSDYNNIINLVLYGMVELNTNKLYDTITDLIIKTEPDYLSIFIPNSKSFVIYLKSLIEEYRASWKEEVFVKLIYAIKDINTARHYFASFRKEFFQMLNDYVIKYREAFDSVAGFYTINTIGEDDQYLQYVEQTSLFSRISELFDEEANVQLYDKKYIVDQMIAHNYHNICFFRLYLLPNLMSRDFNTFEEKHWKMLKTYMGGTTVELGKLLVLLRNTDAYRYEASLPHLHIILIELVKEFPNFLDEEYDNFKLSYISVCTNILFQLHKFTESEYEEDFIELIGQILKNEQIKLFFLENQSSLSGRELTVYVLYYSLTKLKQFNLNLDYYTFIESERDLHFFTETLMEIFNNNGVIEFDIFNNLTDILGINFITYFQKEVYPILNINNDSVEVTTFENLLQS